MNTQAYKSLIFDCDGVVLNSNRLKSRAFYTAALPYGESSAQALVGYHTDHGGVSRYRKFKYFLEQLVPSNALGPGLEELLDVYARNVRKELIDCEIDSGLFELRERTPSASWFIVSGGDQAELRDVFHEKGLDCLFDGGIFGSPDTKDEILTRELRAGKIREPALFLGDSRYDHEASVSTGLDFVFIHQWTEFSLWKPYCEEHGIDFVASLRDLI
ncbi:hypothetical protein N9H49_04765 [Luminiphilus sp.]|nr:hypothetical protein [Luminiphilus sp.]